MNSKIIRVLIVDADPSTVEDALHLKLDRLPGVELVGVAHSQRGALSQVDSTQPNFLLVDLMLPGYRSIDLISQINTTHPEIHILALSPGDIPHERVILAIRAGALGFITRDTSLDEASEAFQQVNQGQHWLPLEDTYEVLGEAAAELTVTTQERRGRLSGVLLGLIPLTGMIAAITAYLWREYWGQIGVRVVDLGVDPATRGIDVLVSLLMVIGIFGPLLFVRSWAEAIGRWIDKDYPFLTDWVANAHQSRLGRLVLNKWIGRGLMILVLLSFLFWLTSFFPLIMVVVFGPVVSVLLLANLLDLDKELPEALHLPHLGTRRVIGFFGVVIILFLMILGAEVWIIGPDLRTDGLHGYLVPEVLGFSANPITLYDLDGNLDPLGALYLGGNADLYVLYDPCTETVRMVPVGSSRVELVDQVVCPKTE
jgi:DNA-binding NarL/FixJ family response regulator